MAAKPELTNESSAETTVCANQKRQSLDFISSETANNSGKVNVAFRGRLKSSKSTDSESNSRSNSFKQSTSCDSSTGTTNQRPARFRNRDSIKVTRKRFTASAHCSYDSNNESSAGSNSELHSLSQSAVDSALASIANEGGGELRRGSIGISKLKAMSEDSMKMLPEIFSEELDLKDIKPFDPRKEPRKSILKKKSDLASKMISCENIPQESTLSDQPSSKDEA